MQQLNMGDLRRLEIFRAGQHQDENGSIDAYSVDDIQQMAESFDPKLSCPLAIGHVDSASPAYGWAKRVWVEGDRLYADIGECVDTVKRWLKNKFYNKVSIEVFPPDHLSNPSPGKWHLARICLLGAAPPAIAGGPPVIPFRFAARLKTYTYSAMERTPQEQLDDLAAQIAELQLQMGKQEFAAAEPMPLEDPMEEEEESEDEAALFAAEDPMGEMDMGDEMAMEEPTPAANPFIDELMLRAGLDMAAASDASGVPLDAINGAIAGGEPLSDEDLTAVMDALFSGGEMAMFAAKTTDMEQITALQQRLAKQEAELNKFTAFVEAEHKLLKSERAAMELEKIRGFCASLVQDRKIRPTEEEATVQLLLNADNTAKRTYAAGTDPRTQREALMASFSDRPPLVDTSEIEAGGAARVGQQSAPRSYAASASEIEIHRAIRSRMAETGETYRDAYRAIVNK